MSDANRTTVYKAISDMLDNPNEYGIYPTTKCYDVLEAALDAKDAEIERLRAELADSISRETVIATEQERDEAREVCRHMWKRNPMPYHQLERDVVNHPWLEVE